MSANSIQNYEYRGNNPKSTVELLEWQAGGHFAEAIESHIPILDCHHHLFGSRSDRHYYRLEDFQRDLDGGHRVIGTVYVEAYDSGWRTSGPVSLRPVGEVEMVEALTERPVRTSRGDCQVAAGIVSYADLELGDAVAEVLEAEKAAGRGRLRGVRYRVAWDGGSISRAINSQPRPGLLLEPSVRRGVAALGVAGLCFETWVYHTQIGELLSLADACPDVTTVVCHLGSPIGVGEYRRAETETFRHWEAGIRELAKRPNIQMKLGGLGMPLWGFGFDDRRKPAQASDLVDAWRPSLDICIDAFGTQRCMFESNFPVDKQSCSYVELWNAYKLYSRAYSPAERADLFYRSACATYGLRDLRALGDAEMGFAS